MRKSHWPLKFPHCATLWPCIVLLCNKKKVQNKVNIGDFYLTVIIVRCDLDLFCSC